MQSRERVLTSLNHKEPDWVPMDSGGNNFTGIQVTAYDRLKRLLGVETPTTIVSKRAQLVAVEDVIKDRLTLSGPHQACYFRRSSIRCRNSASLIPPTCRSTNSPALSTKMTVGVPVTE